MSAKIIDGKSIASEIREQVRTRINARVAAGHRPPGLAVVLAGEDPASKVYVNSKKKACAEVGITSFEHKLPGTVREADLLELVEQLNHNDLVDGILVQMPLPSHIDPELVTDNILPEKDVDGFHPCNIGRLATGRPVFRPCTPKGIMHLLNSTGQEIAGMDAVVLGRSGIVGRPMAMELLARDCTPRICHSQTHDLPSQVRQADILVAAIGKANHVPGEWIKPGAIVIDVGINRLEDGSLVGDVNYESASQVAGFITPVPGGVGPMTIACLLENTLQAAEAHS